MPILKGLTLEDAITSDHDEFSDMLQQCINDDNMALDCDFDEECFLLMGDLGKEVGGLERLDIEYADIMSDLEDSVPGESDEDDFRSRRQRRKNDVVNSQTNEHEPLCGGSSEREQGVWVKLLQELDSVEKCNVPSVVKSRKKSIPKRNVKNRDQYITPSNSQPPQQAAKTEQNINPKKVPTLVNEPILEVPILKGPTLEDLMPILKGLTLEDPITFDLHEFSDKKIINDDNILEQINLMALDCDLDEEGSVFMGDLGKEVGKGTQSGGIFTAGLEQFDIQYADIIGDLEDSVPGESDEDDFRSRRQRRKNDVVNSQTNEHEPLCGGSSEREQGVWVKLLQELDSVEKCNVPSVVKSRKKSIPKRNVKNRDQYTTPNNSQPPQLAAKTEQNINPTKIGRGGKVIRVGQEVAEQMVDQVVAGAAEEENANGGRFSRGGRPRRVGGRMAEGNQVQEK